MNTIIRPLNGEFDIDLGIYFKFASLNRDAWPIPQTVSKWIYDAVYNHTSTPPENKITCVRVKYKPINPQNDFGYHVDFPIYGEYEDFLGERCKAIGLNDVRKWNQKSDPAAFAIWFDSKCQKNTSDRKQLIRIVKYLKAWKDFQSSEIKMPNGIVLTILAAKNYVPGDRDDMVLCKLLDEVYFLLWWDFSIIKPTSPKNDLVESYTESRKRNFMGRLRQFRDDAKKALSTEDKSEAARIWHKHFGDRFN